MRIGVLATVSPLALSGVMFWQTQTRHGLTQGMRLPATYMIDGKQYVMIAASDARNPKGRQGAAYVAFARP